VAWSAVDNGGGPSPPPSPHPRVWGGAEYQQDIPCQEHRSELPTSSTSGLGREDEWLLAVRRAAAGATVKAFESASHPWRVHDGAILRCQDLNGAHPEASHTIEPFSRWGYTATGTRSRFAPELGTNAPPPHLSKVASSSVRMSSRRAGGAPIHTTPPYPAAAGLVRFPDRDSGSFTTAGTDRYGFLAHVSGPSSHRGRAG
jgi:hypothetical protein